AGGAAELPGGHGRRRPALPGSLPGSPVPRVTVVGCANGDFTVAVARLPRRGETVTGGTLLVNRGGKGANQAVAARRLGAEVRMIGAVGADDSGARVREGLRAEGIDVAGLVSIEDAATGTALIAVDALGDNQIAVAPGANHRLTVEATRPHEASIAWAQAMLCQLEVPMHVVRGALAAARRHGVATILNPAPIAALADEVIALADYLTPNEIEAGALAGADEVGDLDEARAAAERVAARGARCVLVTLGARGVLCL